MDKFLAEVKTGQFSLHQPKPIKIKGGISNVRKLYTGREGNIWKYSMLGSQNAISETPDIPKTDAEVKEEKKKDESKLADDIAKKVIEDMTKQEDIKKEAQRGLLGGGGKGTQSEASKIVGELTKREQEKEAKAKAEEEAQQKRSDEATPPGDVPPYDLSTEAGKKGLEELNQYYIDKFGKKESAIKRQEIKEDSEGFTITYDAFKKINQEITKFNLSDKRRWEEWAHNILVEFGDTIIDALGKGTGLALQEYGGIPMQASEKYIDKIKDILKQYKPKEAKDFVKSMKEMQTALLDGKPHWKAKINKLSKDAFDKFLKEFMGGIGADTGKGGRFGM
jgi:hypothetical protein